MFAEVIGMKRGIMAAALLLTSAGFASADYVILVANVGGGSTELKGTSGSGMVGMMGMMGMGGMRGAAGSGGFGPGGPGGARGVGPGGPTGSGGFGPGGPTGSGGFGPGGPGGARSPAGAMMGMRGGSSGMMMGMMGGNGGALDADDVPSFVISVVEIKPKSKKNLLEHFKNVEQFKQKSKPEDLQIAEQNKLLQFADQVYLPERLGKVCNLLNNPPFLEVFLITENGKPIPTVADRFHARFAKTAKEKPSAGDLLDLAGWTLEHGLVDQFPQVMDKLVEIDKSHPAAVAYLQVKAELDRKAGDDPSIEDRRGKLLSGYKTSETPHYLIVHAANDAVTDNVAMHGKYLENAFRSFYYWFALKQTDSKRPLPSVPRNRQVVILTDQPKDFERLHEILNSGPMVVDGFFARHENLSVMSSKHQEDSYAALNTYWETWRNKGYHRLDLLNGQRGKTGVPANAQDSLSICTAQTIALMLKALEQEAILATVSHDASRQLLFASGLLPHNVAAPEWILFGMGSFFETPLQAPWPTVAAPAPTICRAGESIKKTRADWKRRGLATLRKTVTDGYFRTLPPDGKADSEEHRLHEAALRKARTVSWSLTYYLAQQKLDGLRRYFAELSKMPRDLELDDAVLLGCFARAFGCVDSGNKVDDAKLNNLANDWYSYWQRVTFESEPTMKDIRDRIAKKLKEAQEQAQKQSEANNGQGQSGMPGMPGMPGMRPGGPGMPGGSGGFGPGGPGGSGGFGPGGPQKNGPMPPGGRRPGGN